MAIIALTQRPRLTQNGDAVLDTLPLTLDDHDPRVTAAKAAEKQLYDFYGISYTIRQIMLPRYGITVRITATGEGDPVVIVPGNTGDGFPFAALLPHLPGRRIFILNRPGGGLSEGMDHTTVNFHDFAVETVTTVFDALGFPMTAYRRSRALLRTFAMTVILASNNCRRLFPIR